MAQSNLTGLVSGLDSGKIIEATLGVKRLPIKRLEKLVQGVGAKITAVSELQAQLMKLEEHMDGMEELSEVLALSGTIGSAVRGGFLARHWARAARSPARPARATPRDDEFDSGYRSWIWLCAARRRHSSRGRQDAQRPPPDFPGWPAARPCP